MICQMHHNLADLSLHSSIRASRPTPKSACGLNRSKVSSRERQRKRERERRERMREIPRTLEQNWIARKILIWHPHRYTPACLVPADSALVTLSLFISSWKLPPFTCPSHLAFLPPAANRPNPLQGRTVFSPAVGCRLLSTRDMRSEPRNDRCALRQRRSRIAQFRVSARFASTSPRERQSFATLSLARLFAPSPASLSS